MQKSSTAEVQSSPPLLPGKLLFILSKEAALSERIKAVEEILEQPANQSFRDEMARRVLQFLPVDRLVPELYKQWRPLVADAMFFMLSRLSARRLAPKLIEQIDLPSETEAEERLLRLIAKVPGLQKLGQVLARNRNLPQPLRRALSHLENGICDVDASVIQTIIRSELSQQLVAWHVDVNPRIYVEASVSAVVRFTWAEQHVRGRQRGVFKVLKPYIPECFSEDIHLLARLASYLGSKHRQYGFPPHVLADTFNDVRRLLQHEVDFAREQLTLQKALQLYRNVAGVSVPRVITQLCTPRITAITEERGKKITDAVKRMPAWRRAEVAEQLVDALIAVPLFASAGDVMFHADPHAGNLLYERRKSQLVILDWALTEHLTLAQRRHLAMLFLMIVLRDSVGASEAIQALSLPGRREKSKAPIIRNTIVEYLNSLPVKRVPGAVDAMNVLERVAWSGVHLPPSLVMFRKALFTLDGILHDIGAPDFSMESVMARHIMKSWVGGWKRVGTPLSWQDWALVQCSALLFPGRLGLQGVQSLLERPRRAAAH